MDDDKSLQEALDTAAPLAPDSHEMRGTFAADIYLSSEPWDFSKGNAEITIGESHPFQQGKDEVSDVNRENTGDYGIRYHITLKTKGSGKYKLYINPMGGVYMGTFEIGQNKNSSAPIAQTGHWGRQRVAFRRAHGMPERISTSASSPLAPRTCRSAFCWWPRISD